LIFVLERGILIDVAADRRTMKDLRNRITSRFSNFDREVEEGNKEQQWATKHNLE